MANKEGEIRSAAEEIPQYALDHGTYLSSYTENLSVPLFPISFSL